MNRDQFNQYRNNMIARKAKWDSNQEGVFGKKNESEVKESLFVEPELFEPNDDINKDVDKWEENKEVRIETATPVSEYSAVNLEKDAIVVDKAGNIIDEEEKKFAGVSNEQPSVDFRPFEKREADPLNIIMEQTPSVLSEQILAEHVERVDKKNFEDKLKDKAEARKTAKKIIRDVNINEVADTILSVCTLVCGAVATINPNLQIPATALAKSIMDSYGMNYFSGRPVTYSELVNLAQTELKNYTRGGKSNVK